VVGLVDVRRALAAIVLVLAGCGAPPATPTDVVRAYFASIAADPIRTLPLLTDDFHRRHALRVATAADARAVAERRAPDAAADAPLAIDRHQMGWLAMLARPELARRVGALAIRIGDATEQGDAADVAVHVEPRAGPPFEQRFALVRTGAAWRIDAIEQRGVVAATALDAFAAWPNEAARRAIAAAPR
jgi:hypothetical protein